MRITRITGAFRPFGYPVGPTPAAARYYVVPLAATSRVSATALRLAPLAAARRTSADAPTFAPLAVQPRPPS